MELAATELSSEGERKVIAPINEIPNIVPTSSQIQLPQNEQPHVDQQTGPVQSNSAGTESKIP